MSVPDNDVFRDLVNVAFRFLVDEYEYGKAVSKDCVSIEMHSPKLVVGFHRDRYRVVELTVTRTEDHRKHSLWTLIAMLAPESLKEVRCSIADSDALSRGLDRLAKLCKDHLLGVLSSDESVWRHIDFQTAKAERAATLESRFGNELRQGDAAWTAKDWKQALMLYGAAEEALTARQRRRLAYLRKRRLRR